MWNLIGGKNSNAKSRLPLRIILTIPFLLQIFGVVGLVGYFSLKHSQQAVAQLAHELTEEVNHRIQQQFNSYLATPHYINQLNANAFGLGLLETKDYDLLGRFFWKQLKTFQVSYIGYAPQNGDFISAGYFLDHNEPIIDEKSARTNNIEKVYRTDDQGRRQQLFFKVEKHDPRSEDWYPQALLSRRPSWSTVEQWDENPDVLSITATAPLYDQNQQLLGILFTNLSLAPISDFIQQIQVIPLGKIFIIERNGLLIASSASEPPYTMQGRTATRISATDSTDPLIRVTSQEIQQQSNNFNRIQKYQTLTLMINGDRHFVQVTPWQDPYGLDWLIVVVIPESGFMSEIQKNYRVSILLSLVALVVAIGAGILTARWISLPIDRLNIAATAITQGQWDTPLEKKHRIDEVEKLAQSFDQMREQLRSQFHQMQDLNQALVESGHRLSQILEGLPIGVAVIKLNGGYSYLNRRAESLLGKTLIPTLSLAEIVSTYQLYRAGTSELYPTAELPIVQALEGHTVNADDLEIHRDGQIIVLEAWATPVWDQEGNVSYALATFQDITQRKRLEQEREQVLKQLWDSEQRYFTLANTAPVGIFRTDTQGNCLYGNERSFSMIGQTQISSITMGWSDTLHPEDREWVIATWYQTIEQDIPFSCEYRFVRPDGSIVWVYGQGISEKDAEGNIVGFIGTITDITDRKLAEIALSQSEARFRRLTEHIPGVIYRYVTYADGTEAFTYISPALRELYELDPEPVLEDAQKFWLLILPEDVVQMKAAVMIAIQTLQPWSAQYRIITPSGELKWSETLSAPQPQPNGDIIWDGFIIDITDRKLAETALQDSEARLRDVLENAATLISSICLEPNRCWNYEYISPRVEAVVGFTVIELETEPDLWISRIDPHDLIAIQPNLEQVLSNSTFTVEYRFQHKKGNWIWLLQTLISRWDTNSNCWKITGVTTDITERKQAEQLITNYNRILEEKIIQRTVALQEREEWFRTIYNGVNDAIFIHEPKTGTIVDVNEKACEMFGYSREEILNLTVEAITAGEPISTPSEAMEKLKQAGEGMPQVYEWRGKCKNGDLFWNEVNVRRTSIGQKDYIVVTARDITYRKQAEEALQQANFELERLASVDSLTQIGNRRCFDTYFAQEWKRLTRTGKPLSLILCDVDYFKRYNDLYGHQQGDRCLQKVAQAMNHIVKRSSDLVARYGGEEFAVILPNSELAGTIMVAELIQLEIKSLKLIHEGSDINPFITLSLGISSIIPKSSDLPETLIKQADLALYQAKTQGRNQYCIFKN